LSTSFRARRRQNFWDDRSTKDQLEQGVVGSLRQRLVKSHIGINESFQRGIWVFHREYRLAQGVKVRWRAVFCRQAGHFRFQDHPHLP
jgi:hypothetical protein